MTGPPELIKAIKDGNERYRGIPDPDAEKDYLYYPPGDLWDVYALYPLPERIFKGRKIEDEILEHYPENPIHKIIEELTGKPVLIQY